MKVRKGDTVVVLSGKDKGREGVVLSALPTKNKVVVDGINIAKRHSKPSKANEQGGIVDTPMPLDASNVAVLAPNGKPARVGFKVNADGTKVRVDRKSGVELP
jgi:large subunit ribosomal protein L24